MFTTNTTNITQIQLNYKMLQLDNYVATLLQLSHIPSYLQPRYNPMSQLHSYMAAALQPYVAARLQNVAPLCHIVGEKGGDLSPPELQ